MIFGSSSNWVPVATNGLGAGLGKQITVFIMNWFQMSYSKCSSFLLSLIYFLVVSLLTFLFTFCLCLLFLYLIIYFLYSFILVLFLHDLLSYLLFLPSFIVFLLAFFLTFYFLFTSSFFPFHPLFSSLLFNSFLSCIFFLFIEKGNYIPNGCQKRGGGRDWRGNDCL